MSGRVDLHGACQIVPPLQQVNFQPVKVVHCTFFGVELRFGGMQVGAGPMGGFENIILAWGGGDPVSDPELYCW
jgi:hypothetical protein